MILLDWLRYLRRKPKAEAIAEIERIDAGRRGFLGMAIGAGLAAALDPEALLWTPGKLVSIPEPLALAKIDINQLIANMVDRTEWLWYDTRPIIGLDPARALAAYSNPPIVTRSGRPPLPQPLPTRFSPEMIWSFEAIDRARRASPLEIAASKRRLEPLRRRRRRRLKPGL